MLLSRFPVLLYSTSDSLGRSHFDIRFLSQQLMKALHCWEPAAQPHFAVCVAKLETFQQKKDLKDDPQINLNGSLILQTLLTFSKPIKVVESLLSTGVDDLLILFGDMRGSHVMDAFMTSASIGEKSREKMGRKLRGRLAQMACSKSGSRSLDAMWAAMNVAQRQQVLAELAPKEAVLNGNQYGKIVASKYQLALYKHRPESWAEHQGATNKKRKLFEDILGDVAPKK